ncbi:glycosyltransferase family 4 protein [Clostridium fungisolvens]|uniref:Alpha-monoglucosyldiacylglycerol synthase n=1 Tax=Clostridium fungisolvens TaxID=1604897 RepID=A0A6V8SI01_9CLOT|nr:glycosyltransferase family 4 protein [Clostridium fungisolvens]GFP76817.1 Alpha-monoglucosyldiacylglycerol synthase [Clostridium fungisolvens]
MKILITTDTYFPMVNGVITSVNNLYKELKRMGHKVKILTLSHSGNEEIHGDVYYLKSLGIGVYPDARIKFPLHNKLVGEIIRWNPDIIHSQTEFSMMMVSKYISNKLDIPHIHTYHTMYEDYLCYLLGGKLINKNTSAKIIKMLLNSLDSIIAPTEKAKSSLLNYGINKPIYVIPTGIDLSKFKQQVSTEEKQEIMNALNIKKEDRIIAYIGRIGQEKNISEIISFMPNLIEENNNLKLLVVGGGPYLDNLKNQVISKNIEDRVIFTGMVDSNEVYKYYKIAEIFVTASTSETQGLTYLESLSSGCPVVCKYDPCIDGVIDQGKNGYTYKQELEFRKYIDRILKDDSLRYDMKKYAEIKANEYSSRIFANKVLEKYIKTISRSEEIGLDLGALINHKT